MTRGPQAAHPTRHLPTMCWPALLTLLALTSPPADAQGGGAFREYWGVYGTVNYSSWDGLGDVQPIGRGGPFETSGNGIDFGGYGSVARWRSVWILAGAELGFLGFNSDVIFDTPARPESAFEVNHITASLKFRLGEPAGRYLDLGLGLGPYFADTKYIDCSVITRCFLADTRDTATGMYLELSGTPGKGILLGARIHRVDFDPIEAVDLARRKLKGPIYSVFIGWEFSNWNR